MQHEEAKKLAQHHSNGKGIIGVEKAAPETKKSASEEEQEEFLRSRGLSKSIFFKLLMKNGVLLNEYEKALVTTVFGMKLLNCNKLDYEKLDNAFEGVQAQLYAQNVNYTS